MRQRDIKKYKDSDKTELQFYAVRDTNSRIHCASLFDEEPNLNWRFVKTDEPRDGSHSSIIRSYDWEQITETPKDGNPFLEAPASKMMGMRVNIWSVDRDGKPVEIVPFNPKEYYASGYMPYKYREVLGTWEQYVEAYGANIAKDWDYNESRRRQAEETKERNERYQARQETVKPLIELVFGITILPDQIPRWIISSDRERFDAFVNRLNKVVKLAEAEGLPAIPPRDFTQL